MHNLVFDFGNVIGYFDHERTLRRLARHTDLSIGEMRALVYDTPLEDAYEAGRISTEAFVAEAHRRWRLRCGPDELAAAWADIFEPNPDVCGLIPKLKGRYRIFLGSNTNDLHARQFRRQFADTLAHFDGLFLSHEIGVRKPDCGFFAHCQRQVAAPPERCLFIDDLPANVAGAKTCGWHGIVFRGCQELEAQLRNLGILD
jgi:FMN phosphatase YigB (HAD superfamily)